MVTPDQKGITTNEVNAPYEKGICNIQQEIDDVIFSFTVFRSSTHRRRTIMAYLESLGNFERESCALYVKILIWNFDPI